MCDKLGEREPGKPLSVVLRRRWSCWPGDMGFGLSVMPPWAYACGWLELCSDEMLEGAPLGDKLVACDVGAGKYGR
jgi:hypothetical protein